MQLTSSLKNVFETWVCVDSGTFFNQEDHSLDIHTSASSSVPLDIPTTPQFNRQSMPTAMIWMEKLELVSHSCKILSQESRMMDQPVNTQVPANARVRMMGAPSKVCYIITSLTIRMFLGDRHRLLYRIVRAKTPSPLMRPCPRCFEYLLNLPHLYYSTTLTSPIISSCQLFTPSLKSSPRSQQSQQPLSSWEGAGDILRWWLILESLYGHWWDLDNKRASVISCRPQDISKRSLG